MSSSRRCRRRLKPCDEDTGGLLNVDSTGYPWAGEDVTDDSMTPYLYDSMTLYLDDSNPEYLLPTLPKLLHPEEEEEEEEEET